MIKYEMLYILPHCSQQMIVTTEYCLQPAQHTDLWTIQCDYSVKAFEMFGQMLPPD